LPPTGDIKIMVINNQFSSINSTVIGNGQTSINGQTSTNGKNQPRTDARQARAAQTREARTNQQTQPQPQTRTPNTGNIQSNVVEGDSIILNNSVIGNGQNTLNKIG
jgi:hypothetical protein